MAKKLILITNPGSSSRKYALYSGEELLCNLHFEAEDGRVICTVKRADGTKNKLTEDFKKLTTAVSRLQEILTDEGYLDEKTKISAIVARVAAPGEYFSHDHLVDEECLANLEIAKKRAPLHVPVVANEIEQLVKAFEGTPVITVSDSQFHNSREEIVKRYAFDPELADKIEVRRYGYHGLSMDSISYQMKKADILPEKTIVCHLGSGSSITAFKNGKSFETTMGYSPLSGLMMATRVGRIDTAAALAIKREKGFNDEELEEYLNKDCGLSGVSGETNDMREIIRLRNEGNERAKMAYEMFIYRVQTAIGQLAAALGGVDALVFTATIGERNGEIRGDILRKLEFLGFSVDKKKNSQDIEGDYMNIAGENSKPIYVMKTDETDAMIRRASKLIV